MQLSDIARHVAELLAEHGDIPARIGVTTGEGAWTLLEVDALTVHEPRTIGSPRHRTPYVLIQSTPLNKAIKPTS